MLVVVLCHGSAGESFSKLIQRCSTQELNTPIALVRKHLTQDEQYYLLSVTSDGKQPVARAKIVGGKASSVQEQLEQKDNVQFKVPILFWAAYLNKGDAVEALLNNGNADANAPIDFSGDIKMTAGDFVELLAASNPEKYVRVCVCVCVEVSQ